MHDIITIGSATVDIFMKSSEFHLQSVGEGILLCEKYGGKLNIEDCLVTSGGAGTNTAVGFTRMGFRTAAVIEMGSDLFAQIIWDDLKKEKVDTSFIVSEKSETTECVQWGVHNAASVVKHMGAKKGLLRRSEIYSG